MPEEVKRERCFLYSPDSPKGKLFESAEAIEAALKDGWVESAGEVKAPATGGKGKSTNDRK